MLKKKREFLCFLRSYLENCKPRIKVKASHIAFSEINSDVPLESVLGPLLITLYI